MAAQMGPPATQTSARCSLRLDDTTEPRCGSAQAFDAATAQAVIDPISAQMIAASCRRRRSSQSTAHAPACTEANPDQREEHPYIALFATTE
ncbi:MAG TPA: hypothetical protein VM847_05135 [Tahibacter sp.]|nr:hypothetical protein [Tahibacter sp.]